MGIKKIIGIIFGSFFVFLIGVYIYQSIHYQTKFLPYTKVNGIAIEKMTIEEANKSLQDYYRNKEFSVLENKRELLTFNGADIGITDDFTSKLTSLKASQNQWTWIDRMIKKTDEKNELKDITYNEAAFNHFFNELPLVSSERIQPENAKIKKTETEFKLVPEILGNTFDLSKVRHTLVTAIDEGKFTIDLVGQYQQPTVFQDNADLNKTFNTLETLRKETVSYTIHNQTETVAPATLFSWIGVSKENDIAIDEPAIATYIDSLNTTYSTKGKARSFKSTQRGEVSVPAGIYGWNLLVESETSSLVADILSQTNLENRNPQYEGSGYGVDIGDTYVEVDLEAQHMWFYREGSIFLETDIVSGKPTTPTPTGIFYIWNQEPNAILRGEDYATPVRYWMPIDWDGVGIHDSSWQSAYGGDLHLTKGSHGCINTPPAIMEQLFERAPVGTPVLIF